MARQFTRSYTHDHVVVGDGSVEFRCSTDVNEWPWLALPPHHPIVIQTQNFWASVGAIMALGGMEDGQWSALTWTDWECGEPGCGHAVRGEYSREVSEDGERYVLALFDEADDKVARMRGRGVVFRNRNFEEWREGAKTKAREAAKIDEFVFADRAALGLSRAEFPFVAPMSAGATYVDALVTREIGFSPSNPVIGGSGDHVNSTHIGEVFRQVLCLITGDADVQVPSGEMSLNRYIELGTPFRVNLIRQDKNEIELHLEQLGKPCAQILLHWQHS